MTLAGTFLSKKHKTVNTMIKTESAYTVNGLLVFKDKSVTQLEGIKRTYNTQMRTLVQK